jgi:hypothetical protein
MLMRTLLKFGPIWLPFVLAFHSPVPGLAQTIPVPLPRMNILVVQGEAAIHDIRHPKGTDLVVRVRDGNRHPLAQAPVSFTLPANGPSGSFPNEARTLTVTSDKDGYAIVRNLKPNAEAGPFRIEIEATHNGQAATATMTQFNMNVVSKSGSGKWIALVAAAGAAAAGGAIAMTRNGSQTSTPTAPPPIGITAGPGSVGAPR